MMSSSGTSRGATIRTNKNKTQQAPQQTHTQNVNKTDTQTKNQATAEQIRLASLISDKHGGEDPELQKKVKQVMDVTGREEEDVIVALHDCDNDPNRAINMLVEGGHDQGEWQETSSKKKKKQPAPNKSDSVISDLKPEKREKSKEREFSDKPERDRDNYTSRDRRNRQPPRLARKNREMRESRENMENERNDSESRDRGRGRGRGGQINGPSRGRGRGRGGFRGNRFERERERGPQIDTWTNETAANAEKENSNSWADGAEDWTADEWTGSLEESKVFTASSNVPEGPPKGVFSGIGDNDAKMFTPPVTVVDSFSSTFSSMNPATNGGPALNDTTNTLHTGASLINSIGQSPIGTRSSDQLGQKLDLGMLLNKKPEPDATSQPPTQFNTRLDLSMLLQGKPTVDPDTASQQQFMSQLTKQSSEVLKNAIGIGNSSTSTPPVASVTTPTISSNVGPPPRTSQLSPLGSTTQLNSTNMQAVNSRPKQTRTKLPPPSKIPASAVEMPAHIGSFQLDVQFGNLDFGNDNGFSINADKASSTSFSSTAGSTATSSVLSNHIGHTPKSSVETTSTNHHSVMASSVISSVTTTTPSSITGLDVISQNLTSPRPGMYQKSAPSTPSKQDYTPEISQNKMTSPDPIPYPSQERKSSPHYPRSSQQTSNAISSKSISSPPYSQSSYSTGYSSSGYQSQKAVTTASSYSHTSNSLNSQYPTHSNHQGYHQSNSFQNQNSYNSSSQGQNSSLYQTTGQTSGSYQGQTGSSYPSQSNSTYTNQSGSSSNSTYPNQTGSSSNSTFTNQTGSSSNSTYPSQTGSSSNSTYPNQSGSSTYQNQSSGYHSRDSQSTGSTYQPSISQTSASYETGSQSTTSYNSTTASQSNNTSYQRDGQSSQSGYGSHQSYGSTNHQNNLQTSPMSISTNKLSDTMSKISVKDSTLDSHPTATQHSYEHTSNVTTTPNLAVTTVTTVSSLSSGSVSVSSALGLTSASTVAVTTASVNSLGNKTNLPNVSKAPPNLPPGVPLVPGHNYMIGQIPFFGIAPAAQTPIYNYEDLQAQLLAQQRGMTMPGYYDMPLQPTPTTLTGREQNTLANVPYTAGADGKLNRVEAQSPVQAQTSTQQHTAGTAQQAFINPAAATLPPGYNYYTYPGSMLPTGAYQYTPAAVFPVGNIQVPAVTQTAHAGSTGATLYQKPGATYGTHTYGTGYEEMGSQTQDFTKYGAASQTQTAKVSAGSAITSNATDLAATYGKTHTQSFDKTTGFHHGGVGGTPPPFSLPLATGTPAGPMGAPAAAAGYPPSYVQMMQPPSQMLHHHLQQDSTGGSSRAAAQTTAQPKTGATKSYGAATYWGAN